MRKSKKVTVNNEEFVVRELTIGQVMPLLPLLTNDNQEIQSDAQYQLMQAAVYRGENQLGDALKEMGFSTYMGLVEHVLEINGLSGKA